MTRSNAREIAVHMIFSLSFGNQSAQELLDSHIRAHGSALIRFDAGESALKSGAVVPYTASEERLAAFRALMRTRPYLTAGFVQSGLYGLREKNQ